MYMKGHICSVLPNSWGHKCAYRNIGIYNIRNRAGQMLEKYRYLKVFSEDNQSLVTFWWILCALILSVDHFSCQLLKNMAFRVNGQFGKSSIEKTLNGSCSETRQDFLVFISLTVCAVEAICLCGLLFCQSSRMCLVPLQK